MAVFFHGPKRYSTIADMQDSKVRTLESPFWYKPEKEFGISYPPYLDNERDRCDMGDHVKGKMPSAAYATIIPNKFKLCYWHFIEMYPRLEEMLKTYYENEPGRDWF